MNIPPTTDCEEFWKQVAETIEKLALSWGRLLPPPIYGTIPSKETDLACDDWIRRWLSGLIAESQPPNDLAPWLSLRSALGAGFAINCGRNRMPIPIQRGLIWEHLLISEWHHQLRDHWVKNGALRN